jgi:UDP-N-acetylglucosamine--N-acetylmuramyl-(pentapeptide) pyrophosphoryl-undecaprenol N-acetylglucosamine transferase
MPALSDTPLVAITCGGTGGHLFPGLAVGEALRARGCDVMLLISPKEVDQQAVKSARGFTVATLPAVAFNRRAPHRFALGFARSFLAARKTFSPRVPSAVLAMGGFTAAPPVLAGKCCGAATFLHESNTIPGRANRWLARWVDAAFVGFQEASARLANPDAVVTGTPVRPQFLGLDAARCRAALGLDPQRPVLLVTGGSQGASAVNDLTLAALPALVAALPELQFLHLTGPQDAQRVRAAYTAQSARTVVMPFLAEMELALGAATVAVSRAGASSLAELAATRLPAVLVPFPAAADNHQFFNARAFVETGAAKMLEQNPGAAERLPGMVTELLNDMAARGAMGAALARWHTPDAAEQIAGRILQAIRRGQSPASHHNKGGAGGANRVALLQGVIG